MLVFPVIIVVSAGDCTMFGFKRKKKPNTESTPVESSVVEQEILAPETTEDASKETSIKADNAPLEEPKFAVEVTAEPVKEEAVLESESLVTLCKNCRIW